MKKLWDRTVYTIDQLLRRIKSATVTTLWCVAYGLRAAFVLSGALIVGRVVYDVLSQVCPQILVTLFCVYVVLQIWDWLDRASDRAGCWLDSKLENIRDILPGWSDHD